MKQLIVMDQLWHLVRYQTLTTDKKSLKLPSCKEAREKIDGHDRQ
jgi:hypothetical protein